MASVNQEETELKGGHAPAVKVAGVRITQNKPQQENQPKTKEEVEEEKRMQQSAAVVAKAAAQRMLIAGAPTEGNQDFTVEAVKSYHEKPQPTVQPPHVSQYHHLQQPRK